MSIIKYTGIFLIILLLTECHQQQKQADGVFSGTGTVNLSESALIADTVLYNVLMVNSDSLDAWSNHRLRYVRHEDMMFEKTWRYSATENIFRKQVHSFVLAYARLTDEGVRLEEMKAAFKVKMAKPIHTSHRPTM